jgi:hypothetical protein
MGFGGIVMLVFVMVLIALIAWVVTRLLPCTARPLSRRDESTARSTTVGIGCSMLDA